MISVLQIEKLKDIALRARDNAFVPRSGHKIGACILSTDEKYFGGCNIESNISGLGDCAERVAINNAIVNGKYQYQALLVIDDKPTLPCGACLQYLTEFYVITEINIPIFSCGLDGTTEQYTLLELLPKGYLPHHDLKKIKSYVNK